MPFKMCKLNVVNMNKQAKLFSQGMHPVVRIGDNGKWELTKDNPTYFVRLQIICRSPLESFKNKISPIYTG